MTPPAPHREPLTIRQAGPADREFVRAACARLAAFELPPSRAPQDVVAGERRAIEGFFAAPHPGTAVLLAVEDDAPLGFAYVETVTDYFTGEIHGHLGMLVVVEAGEGRGIGSALVRAAEDWSRARGHRRLTLNVFGTNVHARAVYEHLGYEVETVRYVRVFDPKTPASRRGGRG